MSRIALIDCDELKRILFYDKSTGIFTWITPTSNRVKHGDIAGSLYEDGYIRISIHGRKYLAHILAWLYAYGEYPSLLIDHKDTIKSNNKIDNLRLASKSDNELNTPLRKTNTSGQRGVYPYRRDNSWEVKFVLKGTIHYLGRFLDKNEAIRIARKFIKENHGDFKYKEEPCHV